MKIHLPIRRTVMMLVAVLACLSAAQAVEADRTDEIKHAVRVLKGIDKDQTQDWAIAVLKTAAEADSIPYAMNSLGLAYMAGVGVERDSLNAVLWLERAGRLGFREAYHNLGMMYKNAQCGVRQDFGRAYRYFRLGADQGSVMCLYDAGFMLYKGLGCGQDYAAAAEMFDRGTGKDHSPCLYMLGLCYRNGYGVEQDTVRAAYLLGRAAMLGYKPAIEESRRSQPENYMHEEFAANETYGKVPRMMPDISPQVNDTSLLSGSWHGFIVMYDWSGRYILGEKPVALSIGREAAGAVGTLVMGNDTVPFKASVSPEGRLTFTDGGVELNERYTVGRKVPYRMDNATLDIWGDKITGSLSLYSLKVMEPERPMYIELAKGGKGSTASSASEDESGSIFASPNPFYTSFTAAFSLLHGCEPQVRMYDKYGKMVFSQPLGHLDAGRHTVTLAPNILSGTYVLNIRAGEHVLRTIIVKN